MTNKSTYQSKRDRATELLTSGLTEMFSSKEEFKSYLDVASRFPHYSVKNQVLVYKQFPEATMLMGFGQWHKIE